MNPRVDFYFNKSEKWQEAQLHMRRIALDCGLNEELKWGVPCYTYNGGNVLLIHEFKDYCAFLFTKGALLSDPAGILIQQTRNVQAARQIRFTHASQVAGLEDILKAYILEAIEIEKSGVKVDLKKTTEYPIPEEFRLKLESIPELKTAFESLTPGRQRAYLLHFAQPKQSKTREARVEKCIPDILNGKGMND